MFSTLKRGFSKNKIIIKPACFAHPEKLHPMSASHRFKNSCVYCCSVAKSYPTLFDPMDWITPGSSLLHYLPALAQIHIH